MERTTSSSISQIVAQEYFSKPSQAVFRSYELTAYNLIEFEIAHPMLDLGCSNGAFGAVFARLKNLDGLDFGTELSLKHLRQASRRRIYKAVFESDARALPIKAGALRFILCNGVLCCVYPGYNLALRELSRVLQIGGQFIMTVPTPGFTASLLPTRLFERLGLHKLASTYCKRVNARNGHWTLESLGVWRKELACVGLKIEHYVHYFAGSEATWWSLLAMRPFQLSAVLRCLPDFLQRFAVRFTETVIRSVPRTTHPEEKQSGYLLIIARKV